LLDEFFEYFCALVDLVPVFSQVVEHFVVVLDFHVVVILELLVFGILDLFLLVSNFVLNGINLVQIGSPRFLQ